LHIFLGGQFLSLQKLPFVGETLVETLGDEALGLVETFFTETLDLTETFFTEAFGFEIFGQFLC